MIRVTHNPSQQIKTIRAYCDWCGGEREVQIGASNQQNPFDFLAGYFNWVLGAAFYSETPHFCSHRCRHERLVADDEQPSM